METIHSRTEMLIGKDKAERLRGCSVAVFGLGGVGSYLVEGLARCGVGRLFLCDGDEVAETNINRQIIALHSTVGIRKTEAERARICDINPEIQIETADIFFDESKADTVDFGRFDYVADAIDTVKSKLLIIKKAKEAGVPVISCMGTGNKLDPTRFEITDIKKTSVCPLARVMRRELKNMGIEGVKVLYSREEPARAEPGNAPASISFVPSVAGLMMAGEIIRDLIADV